MRLEFALTCVIGLAQCRNKQQPILLNPKGIDQPPIGFGTWNMKDDLDNTTNAVAFAIENGYRQIDGAAVYRNEQAVGEGIRKGLKNANLKREDIWVTSKLWNDQYDSHSRRDMPPNMTQSCCRPRRSRSESNPQRPWPRISGFVPNALACWQRS